MNNSGGWGVIQASFSIAEASKEILWEDLCLVQAPEIFFKFGFFSNVCPMGCCLSPSFTYEKLCEPVSKSQINEDLSHLQLSHIQQISFPTVEEAWPSSSLLCHQQASCLILRLIVSSCLGQLLCSAKIRHLSFFRFLCKDQHIASSHCSSCCIESFL